MTLVDLAGKTPDELEALAAQYRQAANDAEHLRILKLQRDRDNVVELSARIQSKPTIGSYRRQGEPLTRSIDPVAIMRERQHDDPARLEEIVREVARFTNDREVIARTAVDWATDCGIDEATFVPIIVTAMNGLQRGGRQHAG